jgi:hypothetical protein
LQLIKIHGKDIQVQGSLVRIARLDLERYEALNDPELLIGSLQRSAQRIDIFTFMQLSPDTSPKYAYPMEWDNLAVLPISTFDDWWTRQIRSECRNRARQAEKKGLTIHEIEFNDALVEGIHQIYNECPVRQGRQFAHYGEDVETVYNETATYLDRSIFIGAFHDQKLIGFTKLTCDDTRQATIMNLLSLARYKDKAPTNALIAQAVRSCAQRSIRYLVYQKFSYGRKQHDSLSKFKEVNGFQRVDLPRYYVPLTRIGSAALRLGLHHRLTDHLPELVFKTLRSLRDSWYNRRFHSALKSDNN